MVKMGRDAYRVLELATGAGPYRFHGRTGIIIVA